MLVEAQPAINEASIAAQHRRSHATASKRRC
jgi:hypothetical protein